MRDYLKKELKRKAKYDKKDKVKKLLDDHDYHYRTVHSGFKEAVRKESTEAMKAFINYCQNNGLNITKSYFDLALANDPGEPEVFKLLFEAADDKWLKDDQFTEFVQTSLKEGTIVNLHDGSDQLANKVESALQDQPASMLKYAAKIVRSSTGFGTSYTEIFNWLHDQIKIKQNLTEKAIKYILKSSNLTTFMVEHELFDYDQFTTSHITTVLNEFNSYNSSEIWQEMLKLIFCNRQDFNQKLLQASVKNGYYPGVRFCLDNNVKPNPDIFQSFLKSNISSSNNDERDLIGAKLVQNKPFDQDNDGTDFYQEIVKNNMWRTAKAMFKENIPFPKDNELSSKLKNLLVLWGGVDQSEIEEQLTSHFL